MTKEKIGRANSTIRIYDSGPSTADRYTVFDDGVAVYGMSDNAMSPQGFNQYLGDTVQEQNAGRRITDSRELGDELCRAIVDRFMH